MMRSIIRSKSGRWILTALALIFWISVWWFFALRVDKAWVLPTPSQTAKALWELLKDETFRASCVATLGQLDAGDGVPNVSGHL